MVIGYLVKLVEITYLQDSNDMLSRIDDVFLKPVSFPDVGSEMTWYPFGRFDVDGFPDLWVQIGWKRGKFLQGDLRAELFWELGLLLSCVRYLVLIESASSIIFLVLVTKKIASGKKD